MKWNSFLAKPSSGDCCQLLLSWPRGRPPRPVPLPSRFPLVLTREGRLRVAGLSRPRKAPLVLPPRPPQKLAGPISSPAGFPAPSVWVDSTQTDHRHLSPFSPPAAAAYLFQRQLSPTPGYPSQYQLYAMENTRQTILNDYITSQQMQVSLRPDVARGLSPREQQLGLPYPATRGVCLCGRMGAGAPRFSPSGWGGRERGSPSWAPEGGQRTWGRGCLVSETGFPAVV